MKYTTGTEKVIARLQDIKKNKAKSAIRKGTRAGAKIVAAEATATAPYKTGTLQRSIKVRAYPRSRKWTGTQARMTVFYGAFLEYGTKHFQAKHFMREATDKVKGQAADKAIEIILNEVTK